jgi:16S rRNA (guanine966-N2)-methyltransferase
MPYIRDAKYLDLFSGTGSYLFEAVSRGAADCTGVEMEPRLADAINKQAEKLGVADQLNCDTADVFRTIPELSQSGQRFDIIMAAPPQYKKMLDRTLDLIINHPLLTPDGLLLCQHDSSELVRYDQNALEITQARRYGNTTFTILTIKNPD